jgi:hypothetical protein
MSPTTLLSTPRNRPVEMPGMRTGDGSRIRDFLTRTITWHSAGQPVRNIRSAFPTDVPIRAFRVGYHPLFWGRPARGAAGVRSPEEGPARNETLINNSAWFGSPQGDSGRFRPFLRRSGEGPKIRSWRAFPETPENPTPARSSRPGARVETLSMQLMGISTQPVKNVGHTPFLLGVASSCHICRSVFTAQFCQLPASKSPVILFIS